MKPIPLIAILGTLTAAMADSWSPGAIAAQVESVLPISGRPTPEHGRIVGRVLSLHEVMGSSEVRLSAVELYLPNARFKTADAAVDAKGGFVFEDVPVGRVRLQAIFSAEGTDGMTLPSTMNLWSGVASGQNREVFLFGRGRPVTGRIVAPGVEAGKVQFGMVLVAPPLRSMRGRPSGQPTTLAQVYERVRTEGGSLVSNVDQDGRFRISGVREGTYWIGAYIRHREGSTQLRFEGKKSPGYPAIDGGKLTVDLIEGGGSDRPLDLGELSFTPPLPP